MANEKPTVCEACPNGGELALINNMWLCMDCYVKETSAPRDEQKSGNDEITVQPSNEPINERLKRSYIDKFNTLLVSGMSHEQIKQHIADLEDMVKVLNTQLQATMDIDEEWSRTLTTEQREELRAQDKKYRALARPATNSDGTIKTPRIAKPKQIGDAGDKAFENLVEKLTRTGMSRENAEKMIRGMKG
jgi:TolA-binding protein